MSKQHTHRFDIDSQFQQSCGEAVPQRVEVGPNNSQLVHDLLKVSLKSARLCRSIGNAEHIFRRLIFHAFPQLLQQERRNRQYPL